MGSLNWFHVTLMDDLFYANISAFIHSCLNLRIKFTCFFVTNAFNFLLLIEQFINTHCSVQASTP